MVDERARTQAADGGSSDAGDHSHDIYTVANIVTVLRLILVPFAFTVLIQGVNDVVAFSLFAIAASTDWLDGQIARRTGTVTVIGKAIDPLVDRLLLAAGVIGLYVIGRLPAWIMVVLVLRDAYLLYGAWRLEHVHVRVPVTFLGKATTFVLLSGFSLLILGWPMAPGLGLVSSAQLPGLGDAAAPLGLLLVYAGLVLSLTTAVQYTALGRRAAERAGADAGSREGGSR